MKSDRTTRKLRGHDRSRVGFARACGLCVAIVAGGCTSVPEFERQLEQIEFGPHQYRVRPSDTILTVAYRYRMTPDDLRRLNPGVTEPLRAGTPLNVYRDPAVIAAEARARREALAAERQSDRAAVVTAPAPPPERIERRPLSSATTRLDEAYTDQALLGMETRRAPAERPVRDWSAVERGTIDAGVPGGPAMDAIPVDPAVSGVDRPQAAPPASQVLTEQRASVRIDPRGQATTSPGRIGDRVARVPEASDARAGATPGGWPREEILPDPLEATLGPQREPRRASESRPVAQVRDDTRVAALARDSEGFAGRWYWPTDGEVARGFRPDQVGGQGVDIAGMPGQDVRAAMDGTVVYSGRDLSGVGNLVILRHPDNLLSTYSHADELYVAEDDVVRAGDPIASLGANENRESVLGFEIRRDGNPLNPLEFLPVQ